MQVSTEATGVRFPWSRSSRWFPAIQCGCWDLNLSPVEEHALNHWAISLVHVFVTGSLVAHAGLEILILLLPPPLSAGTLWVCILFYSVLGMEPRHHACWAGTLSAELRDQFPAPQKLNKSQTRWHTSVTPALRRQGFLHFRERYLSREDRRQWGNEQLSWRHKEMCSLVFGHTPTPTLGRSSKASFVYTVRTCLKIHPPTPTLKKILRWYHYYLFIYLFIFLRRKRCVDNRIILERDWIWGEKEATAGCVEAGGQGVVPSSVLFTHRKRSTDALTSTGGLRCASRTSRCHH